MPTPLTDADKVLRNDTGKDIVEKLDDIAQALGVGVNADQVNYDNTESGLEAENVQNAIDELNDNKADKTDLDITTEITTPASVQTFNDGGDNIPLKSLVTEIVPIQSGSGVPSPSNVRSISGFDIVDVVVSGTNLYNKATRTDDSRLNINTGTVISGSNWCVSDYIPVKGGESYYFKLTSMNSSTYGSVWYDKNKTRISGIPSNDETVNKVHTAPNDACYLRITTAMTGNYAVNYPSTITDYVEFVDSNTHTITLPETIYGGSLECVSGSGQVTHEKVNLSDLTWTKSATDYCFYTTVSTPYLWENNLTMLCSCFKFDGIGNSSIGRYGAENTIRYYYKSGVSHPDYELYLHASVNTVQDLAPIISGQTLVYPLATPTSLSTSGANIPTLSGTNNIYTDCGDIQSLEYFNDKADDIASLVELESGRQIDLVATLVAGQTSLTFTNSQIKEDSTIDIYTDTFGVNPTNVTVTVGHVALTFPAQQSNLGVKVRIS